MNEDLLNYLRENNLLYTRQALDNRLRAAGYTDEEIDAAWQQVLSEVEPRDVSSLAVLTTMLLSGGLLCVVLTNSGPFTFSSSEQPPNPLLPLVNFGSLAVAAVLILATWWLATRTRLSIGLIAVLLIVVALVWYLVVLGACGYRAA